MPEGDVLQGGGRVAAEEAGQAGDALALLRVTFVGHGGGAGLPLSEGLFGLQNLGALEVADLGGELLQAGRDEGKRRHEVSVAVAVDDLGGDGLHQEAEAAADVGLHVRGNGGVGAHGAADLADGDRLLSLGQAMALTAQLIPPRGEFEAEGGRFSVDAMGAADADGLLVLQGLLADGVHEGPQALLQQLRGLHELEGEAGVPDIVRGEADMDVARFGAEGVG